MLLYSEQTGLLNEQWLRVLVRVERELLGTISKLEADFFYNRHLTFCSVLKIYSYPVLPQLPKKTCFSKWNWSVSSETLDTCWSNECLFSGKSVAVSDSSNNNSVTVYRSVCCCLPYSIEAAI